MCGGYNTGYVPKINQADVDRYRAEQERKRQAALKATDSFIDRLYADEGEHEQLFA